MASNSEDQQFCLRWNNFQANITSQFEALRDDEDFTDVTIACEGQRLQAHKVVLSACSPFFKELFKTNPCAHPIIFMRDVEVRQVVALLEYMYAGEVNVAQTHLSAFLKTAESLKIRGLTSADTSEDPRIASVVTSSSQEPDKSKPSHTDDEDKKSQEVDMANDDVVTPKAELPEYLSEEDEEDDADDDSSPMGGMEITPQISSSSPPHLTVHQPINHSSSISDTSLGGGGGKFKIPHSLDPRPCEDCGRVYSNLSNLRQHMKLIHYPTHVQCPMCRKPFKTDLYLRRHLLNCHNHGEGATAKSNVQQLLNRRSPFD